jgi:hypothetical protein
MDYGQGLTYDKVRWTSYSHANISSVTYASSKTHYRNMAYRPVSLELPPYTFQHSVFFSGFITSAQQIDGAVSFAPSLSTAFLAPTNAESGIYNHYSGIYFDYSMTNLATGVLAITLQAYNVNGTSLLNQSLGALSLTARFKRMFFNFNTQACKFTLIFNASATAGFRTGFKINKLQFFVKPYGFPPR